MKTQLFQDTKGKIYTLEDVIISLKEIGADKAKVLYIHTDIGFGKPLVKRKEFISKLYEAITSLGVRTLIFPTYTFSFCNYDDYDIKNSKTTMGILNEYARTQENSFRTKDPLMSVCVIGEVPKEFYNLSKLSCGEGSSFDIMSKSDENMFLFFGAKPTECFTFLHYVEAIYNVPYRYNKEFKGNIIDENGLKSQESYLLYTLYDTVIPYVKIDFQNHLENKGILNKFSLGEKELFLVKGKSVFEEAIKCLDKDINLLLARPYDSYELGTNYVYGNVNSVK
ncbi:AAC(3) family N-acetyltransferase [Aliarcobacter butzleri]|uniref:AAC(3) family N-acetyltransferase n=1 Tax=Aliarcobacter butzleri TaxID=28197 RepID=UPI0021B34E0F|nr:AAC(3) family N-acetyltransferase [Aliarcobacter butzleri]UXC29334.1 AAC(3) family N-acetyltransferase [Aliarcobacter butzleri]